MTDRELLQMALDALEQIHRDNMTTIAEENWSKAIEALRAALANEFNPDWNQVEALQESLREHMAEIQRLRARLAQPEQEPVAWISHNAGLYHGKPDESLNPLPLYTAPPQREWQGLTDEEIDASLGVYDSFGGRLDARKIEAKLKEKNYD